MPSVEIPFLPQFVCLDCGLVDTAEPVPTGLKLPDACHGCGGRGRIFAFRES